jgi:hypothetical protein
VVSYICRLGRFHCDSAGRAAIASPEFTDRSGFPSLASVEALRGGLRRMADPGDDGRPQRETAEPGQHRQRQYKIAELGERRLASEGSREPRR